MNNLLKNIIIIFTLSIGLISCLKSGLDDLPIYSDAEVTNFRFEYRWYDNDSKKLQVVLMDVIKNINTETNTITCDITVPKETKTFVKEIRSNVSLSSLVGYADISSAATLSPLSDSPHLGCIADFGKNNMQYKVTAADGTVKIWNLVINSFNK